MTAHSVDQNLIIKTYEHNGISVDVSFTDDAYFNATVAAKAFGKLPKDWLATKDAQSYIDAVRRKLLTQENQLVIVKQGGREQGTWMHPKLGVAFARWLNVDFSLWCDEMIEGILKGHLTITQSEPAGATFDLAAMTGKALRELAARIEECAALTARVITLQPKADFYDHVAGSDALFDRSDAAKMLRTGPKRLWASLREWKIVQASGTPYQKYYDLGYFRLVPVLVHKGEYSIPYQQTMVTGKGLAWLKALMDSQVMPGKSMAKMEAA